MQGHWHDVHLWGDVAATGPYYQGLAIGTPTNVPGSAKTPVTDGTNGAPRIGLATRDSSVGVLYIIKYK